MIPLFSAPVSPRLRMLATVAVLALGWTGLVAPLSAQAAGACRADPIVTLSNGLTVQITADVATDASNLTSAAYVVHVPAGVSALSITYPDAVGGSKEKTKVSADNPPNLYTTDTSISASGKGIAVTATTSVYATAPNAASASPTQAVSGLTSQHIVAQLSY